MVESHTVQDSPPPPPHPPPPPPPPPPAPPLVGVTPPAKLLARSTWLLDETTRARSVSAPLERLLVRGCVAVTTRRIALPEPDPDPGPDPDPDPEPTGCGGGVPWCPPAAHVTVDEAVGGGRSANPNPDPTRPIASSENASEFTGDAGGRDPSSAPGPAPDPAPFAPSGNSASDAHVSRSAGRDEECGTRGMSRDGDEMADLVGSLAVE